MMKKNLFALLAAVSMIAPAVAAPDTVVANAPVALKLPAIPLSPATQRTLLRCALLCASQNMVKRVFYKKITKQVLSDDSYKAFKGLKIVNALNFLSVSDYVMHFVTYFLNQTLPSTSTATSSQMAEFIAKEWSFIGKDTTNVSTKKLKVFSPSANLDLRSISRIFLKAGSRKSFFLPAESGAREVLASTLGSVMMPVFEGLASDTFDSSGNKAVSNMRAFRPISHAFVGGRFAPALAEDLLLLVSTDPKCPTMLKKFLSTDANWELAKNLLGQFFADVINKGIEAQIKTAEKA